MFINKTDINSDNTPSITEFLKNQGALKEGFECWVMSFGWRNRWCSVFLMIE